MRMVSILPLETEGLNKSFQPRFRVAFLFKKKRKKRKKEKEVFPTVTVLMEFKTGSVPFWERSPSVRSGRCRLLRTPLAQEDNVN